MESPNANAFSPEQRTPARMTGNLAYRLQSY
jgi:hypothetical protein